MKNKKLNKKIKELTDQLIDLQKTQDIINKNQEEINKDVELNLECLFEDTAPENIIKTNYILTKNIFGGEIAKA